MANDQLGLLDEVRRLAQRSDDQQTQLDEQRAQLDEQRRLISAEERLRSALQDRFEELEKKTLADPSRAALPGPSSAAAPAALPAPSQPSLLGPSSAPDDQPTSSDKPAGDMREEEKMTTPYMVFGDDDMYTGGISKQLQLARSLRKEFEGNLGGKYVWLLDYVFREPATELYGPGAKGYAPTPEDVDAYTRDLGREGWMLDDFLTKEGQNPGNLTKLDVGMLRLYTGPVFKPWNFWLRYGRLGPANKTDYVWCCSKTPYYEKDAAFGAFHPGKLFVDDGSGHCRTCKAAKEDHHSQKLDDWSTSIALLYPAIVKLSNQTEEAGDVYRGIDESKVRLPVQFVGKTGKADSRKLLGGVEPAFMSFTQDLHVASLFARDERPRLFKMQLKSTSRGAQLSRFSFYQAEKEMLFPPYTKLSCHGASEELSSSGEPLILDVDATFINDTRLMDMVAGIESENDEPVGGFFARLSSRTGRDVDQLRTLRRLDLRGCKLDHKYLPALCHVIRQNQSLQVLDIRDNEPDLEGDKGLKDDIQLAAFADALRGHPSLHVVYIGASSGLALEVSWMRGQEGFHEGYSCELCQDKSPIVGTRYTYPQATSRDPSALNRSGSVQNLCRWHHHRESGDCQTIEPATFRSLRADDRPEAQQGCATIALKLAKVRQFPDGRGGAHSRTSVHTANNAPVPSCADLGAQAGFNAASTREYDPGPT